MAYTTIDDPSAYFQTVLWTGNTTAPRNITNDGNSDLKPDLIWGKNRTTGSTDNMIFDSSRGFDTDGVLNTNSTAAEGYATTYGYVGAHLTDGFTSTSGGTNDDNWNEDGASYVAWQWKANGGTRVTNTESGNNPGGGYQANTTCLLYTSDAADE